MPKKISVIFDDAIFEKLCQLKKKETYAKYIAQLVDSRFDSTQKNDGGEESENPDAEMLQVSSTKLLSILNAINDRFTYITGLCDRMENLERAMEGLAEGVDSIERTAFENKESIGKMKFAQESILEKFDNTYHNDISSTPLYNRDGQAVKNSQVTGSIDSTGLTPDMDYEFACPHCDETVDENDDYCRWCSFCLSEGGEDVKRDYNAHHEHPESGGNAKYDYGGREPPIVNGNARSGDWGYDLDDNFYPPSGPPSGWNSYNIKIDGNGKPVCPFCIESMTFVQEYERWFCDPCWYYAPSDFMISKSIESIGTKGKFAPKKKKSVLSKKKKNWKKKKLGELPIFKKKRDRR
jgi:hypothetical protein